MNHPHQAERFLASGPRRPNSGNVLIKIPPQKHASTEVQRENHTLGNLPGFLRSTAKPWVSSYNRAC